MITGRYALVLAIALPLMAAGGPVGSAMATEPVPGAKLGKDLNEIIMSLAEAGYVTLRYANKDGRIEIVARRDGQRFYLLVDDASGVIVTVVPEGGDPLLKKPETVPGDDSSSRAAGMEYLSRAIPLRDRGALRPVPRKAFRADVVRQGESLA
ncbi:hypothetical protein [Stappia sp.]|uniref:hypothetical protein n=1 Tax=Stappia sp. TaxID=1870903 RepID=UPI003A999136